MQIHYGRRTAEVDDIGCLVTIPIEHHKIHDGELFICGNDFEGIAAGSGPANRLLIVPSATGSMVHVQFSICTDKEVKVQLFESPTTSAWGTNLSVTNLNRNSSNTATCSVYLAPGLSGSHGTLLCGARFGGANANPRSSEPGQYSRGNEWILNSSYKYILQLNPEASDTNVCVQMSLYEDSMFHD